MTVKEQIKKLKSELAAMSWKQRFEHLWTYYKWVLGVLAGVILVACMVVSAISAKQIDVLFGGMTANLDLSDEAQLYLTEGLENLLVTKDKQQVDLDMTGFGDLADPKMAEYNYNSALQIVALVAAGQLDYVMMDRQAFSFYVTQDVFADLNELLSQQQLAQFEGRIIYAEPPEGERYPIALELSDTDFAKDSELEEVIIAFPGNTKRAYTASRFLDYLLAWGE